MGKFVISLDFELMWGVFDKRTTTDYGANILGVKESLIRTLDLFDEYDVKATIAVVGFLMFENKEILKRNFPKIRPSYLEKKFSPYMDYFESLESSELDDYHFAPRLVEQIVERGHELATHTFCHYYCLEEGQTIKQFKEDLNKSQDICTKFSNAPSSIVFPRNQSSKEYLNVCFEEGIKAYRGNETHWIYKPSNSKSNSMVKRALRLLDSFVNVTGHNTSILGTNHKEILNVPSSRFLRPYDSRLGRIGQHLRLDRIKKSMLYAAKNKQVFHLWWHPHNHGVNMDANMNILEQILKYHRQLSSDYHFKSARMMDLVQS